MVHMINGAPARLLSKAEQTYMDAALRTRALCST